MTISELPFSFVVGLTTLVGLCVGSFLNVVIYRTQEMIALTHPSRCPECNTRLTPAELVPLGSWFFLKGKCAHCHAPISVRYPLVELVTALLWGTCVMHWRNIETALVWSIFCSALLSLALIDWDSMLLPDALTLPLIWAGLVASTLGVIEISTNEAIWGAVVGYGFLWLVSTSFELATGKIGMGGGDLKLLAAIGAWIGPASCLAVVLFASLLGAVVGVALKAKNQVRDGAYVPFGPFLSCSAIFFLFFGKKWLVL